MVARPSEALEEYAERFQYSLKRSPYATLPLLDIVLKNTLIKGMKEQWIETLNIMGKGDVYQEDYVDIIKFCIRCSKGSTRLKLAEHDVTTRDRKISSGSITRAKIGNLLEDFKTYILGTLITQLVIMQAEEQNLVIFCPRCRKKHSHKEFPLERVQTCAICTKDHTTESFPSVLGLKVVYKEAKEETKQVYLLNKNCQWQP